MSNEGFPIPESGPESLITSESRTGIRIEVSSIPSPNDGENFNYWEVKFASPKYVREDNKRGTLGSMVLGSEKEGWNRERAEMAMHYYRELASVLDGSQILDAAGVMRDYVNRALEPTTASH